LAGYGRRAPFPAAFRAGLAAGRLAAPASPPASLAVRSLAVPGSPGARPSGG